MLREIFMVPMNYYVVGIANVAVDHRNLLAKNLIRFVKNFLSSIKRRHLLVILFQFMYSLRPLMTKSRMRMKFGQRLSGCVVENHLVHLAFVCLIYYIGMKQQLPEVWEKLVCLVQDCFEGKAIP
jgi:hypothetical protein